MSFVDFVWRGVCLRVEGEAVAGASNAAGRAGRDVGSVRRLLEPVQHEDVAEGPEADAPQEAPFRYQVDNDGDDSCDNGCPPL